MCFMCVLSKLVCHVVFKLYNIVAKDNTFIIENVGGVNGTQVCLKM
jgi:hypothetical protein